MQLQLPLHLTFPAALCVALLGSATRADAAPVPTTTTLAVTSGGSAVTTVTSGGTVTLTATVVAGATPITVGQVNFCNAAATNCIGLNLLATAQLTSAGTATFKLRPGVGSHSYNAVFVGTPNGAIAYASSTSSAAALSVTGTWPSITTIAANPNGNSYKVTATAGGNASAAPAGTVSFLNSNNGNSVLGTAPLGAGAAGPSFLNVTNAELYEETILTPYSIAVGDFNGDGIPDLAVVNQTAGTVTVMLGNGDGTFTTKSIPQTGISPAYVAVADFNGDGILDMAVTNYGSNNLTVLLGNGDGTFTATATRPETGDGPDSITVGDFNGDGIPDLAVANYDGNSVTILLGNGDGTFTTGASPLTGVNPSSIAIADFNGDGIPDLAVVNSFAITDVSETGNGTVTVLMGNGDGTFTATATSPETGFGPDFVAVGDFNGDGIPDLAVANYCVAYGASCVNGTLTVLLGTGNGAFTSTGSLTTGSNPVSIAVGDFNEDGIADLVVANFTDASLTVFLGFGDGGFWTEATIPTGGEGPSGVAAADFNGDGVSDLAAGVYTDPPNNPNAGAVLVLLTANYTATATDTVMLPSGTEIYQVLASYAGDNNYSASISDAAWAPVAPTVTVTPSLSSITTAELLTVAVAISAPPGYPYPTGVMELVSPGYNVDGALLSGYSGTSSFNIPAGSLATGSDTLTVYYYPDESSSVYYTSANGTGTVFVASGELVTPTVTVTPSSTSITTTQALQVNLSVSGPPGEPSPTGSVRLTSGSYNSGKITLSSSSAQIIIPAWSLPAGTDTLTVSYTPDASGSAVYASASGTSTVVVTAPTLITPTVTVTPSSSSILSTQTLGVGVTVSGPSGESTPTGSVSVASGSYKSGNITLSGGSVTINIPGGSLAAGTDTLTVSYIPDESGATVYTIASGTSTVTVTQFTLITPTVTVTPLATSILTTQSLQVNVGVSGPSGDSTPTGSVDLTSGSYDSGAVTLSGGSVAINIPAGSLSAGTDTLSVSYAPDSASSATYSSATGSSSVTVTAPNASPVVNSISPAIQTAGNAAFTLTVNGSGFDSGSTIYWGTTALTTQFVSATQVTAQVSASDIASSGTDSITVENPSPGGGTSNALEFEVDSSGAGSPSFGVNTATVTAGQSATYSVTLPTAPTAVTASCLNLPTGASCSYSSTASTVTIATTSTTAAGTYQVTVVFAETVAGAASAFIFLPILTLPIMFVRRKWTAGKIWFTACLGLVLLVASAGIGCGGGGSGGTGQPQTHQVTTSAVVTLTVQ